MCGSSTKQRIGTALHQLMNERPLDKITVQNLTDETSMKRQSFYYHFRDTRDVPCCCVSAARSWWSPCGAVCWAIPTGSCWPWRSWRVTAPFTARSRAQCIRILSRELGNQVLWHRSRECQRRQHYLLREHERPLQIAAAFSGFFLVQMLFL